MSPNAGLARSFPQTSIKAPRKAGPSGANLEMGMQVRSSKPNNQLQAERLVAASEVSGLSRGTSRVGWELFCCVEGLSRPFLTVGDHAHSSDRPARRKRPAETLWGAERVVSW